MHDVIVIGAGGGGPVVAKELAQRGLDVLLLEGGARHPDPEETWTRLEDDANNPLWGYFRVGPSDREHPWWLRDTPQNSFVFHVAGVGGTTLHYFGNSPRPSAGAFVGYEGTDRSAYDTAHLFPFSYEELRPYYEWVEATLPVETAPMGTKEEVFFRGCENVGLPVQTTLDVTRDAYRPQQNAILQPEGTAGRTTDPDQLLFPQARGCTMCGYCLQGCNVPRLAPRNLKAKRSTDNSYVPMALTADGWAPGGRAVTLVTDAFVTRIHTRPSLLRGPQATGVTWRDTRTGDRTRADARVVVMAGGVVENPRLWHNSNLPDPNGWVGRGLTDHAFDWVTGVFDEVTDQDKGQDSASRADFPGRGAIENVGLPPSSQVLSMLLSDSGIRGGYDAGRGLTGAWDGETGRPLGTELKDMMRDINKLLNILIITDDDVERRNRVLRSPLPPDRNGPLSKVRMYKRERSRRTRENREWLARKSTEILLAAGARKVVRIDMAPLMLHNQSSMRMGLEARTSVLDANAEAWAVRNLFIADNSAMANSVAGVNPTLTTQAVATRTAEKIFAKYFDGDPWVGDEAPISSADDVVTQAVVAAGVT
jgi:choline dehydrogenase-like flavoprotein